ncbi:MAG: hypothetical protein O3A93_13610, partial [Chloroflexi bacterium]|nr:hypothetical protein [Chloroflexota bacterium]
MALGIAVGKAALSADDDGTAVGCAVAVGEVGPLLATGVVVADEPQAKSRATKIRTTAWGSCLSFRGLVRNFSISFLLGYVLQLTIEEKSYFYISNLKYITVDIQFYKSMDRVCQYGY